MDGEHEKLAAPCSLYCGVCGLHLAYKTNNQRLKEKLGALYQIAPEDIVCEGCRSDVVLGFCRACQIRACALDRKVDGCYACEEFPCSHVTDFPFEAAREFMLSGAEQRKKMGTQRWIEWETERFTCRECGAQAFRGARRCIECKTELAPQA